MTDAELALFLKLREQLQREAREVAKSVKFFEPIGREIAMVVSEFQAAVKHFEPMFRESLKFFENEKRLGLLMVPRPTLIEHQTPMPNWASWRGGARCALCRAPTPAIRPERSQPTRRRIGF